MLQTSTYSTYFLAVDKIYVHSYWRWTKRTLIKNTEGNLQICLIADLLRVVKR